MCEYNVSYFDVIMINDFYNVELFVNMVGLVVVYVNVFMCFMDGVQFGLGVEVVVLI